MTVTEILHLVDQLVFKHTGKHLNNLQKNVVQGIWQGSTYSEMAKEFGYESENHIGNVSRELYKILSEQLGEDINKSNFCWTIERLKDSLKLNSSQLVGIGINSNFHFCPLDQAKNDFCNNNIDKSKESYYDLTLAPKIIHFYNRTTELQTLSDWLTNQNTRLISILGLSGIGKTTLVKQFVDLNLQQFDVVIWKSLKLFRSLDSVITEILTGINTEPIQTDNKLTQLFNFLRQQRFLIVLDDVQELFTSGKFAGQYQSEYKNYKTLFKMMTEIEHQSSLILISQEQCQEMLCLDEELYSVKSLELEGINDTDILNNLGLEDNESWSKLIDLYEGNPAYLKHIASLIKTIFGGKVSDFIRQDSFLITEDMKSKFDELFERLSPVEKQLILELSQSNKPVSREDLRQALLLSSMDLINGLQSLSKRYLLKTKIGDKIWFNLSPVFQEYARYLS
ncbi:MAG: NB-ARC domain-containing protein [Coleofasciculus sp. A1-SPW-01]|uniref:NB-ARC domain-containing protein n=1 Tax=Coleofasciculus sp. A1-SPW-01 TaxID=3070819 RepID=UPI003300CCA9